MNYKGKELDTMGELFDFALKLAKEEDKTESQEFFREYVKQISIKNNYSLEKSTEIAKLNLGYFAGYYNQDVCDLIYKTYNCSHPIFGNKPFEVSPEEAYKKGLERGKSLMKK